MVTPTGPDDSKPPRYAAPPAAAREGRDVVVIGCGTVGTSVFLHLVAPDAKSHHTTGSAPHSDGLRSVCLVDPHPVGWGLAFGDDDPLLMCNSAVNLNSILAERPTDFLDHLREHGWKGHPQDCVPRSWMAAYCHLRYTRASQDAINRGIQVHHVRAAAHTITKQHHTYRIHLDTGAEITASDVVICPGVHRPRTPDGFAPHQHHPRYLDSPYPSARLRRLPAPARVLVLGTHQSAIDAALMLCRAGHHTTLTSPSGRLPAVRTSLKAPTRPHPPLQRLTQLDPTDPHLEEKITRHVVEAIRLIERRPLRQQVSTSLDPAQRLREEITLAETGACLWADICVPVIEAIITLASALPPARRNALIARFTWFTNRYATATTLVNARGLLSHFTSGALQVAASYPTAATFTDGLWHIQRPGAGTEYFDHIVNATGFHPPQLSWGPHNDTLHLDHAPAPPPDAHPIDHLEADLRLRRRPTAPPERIWLAGVGTHIRIPFANHLRNAVHQAQQVAEQVRA